MRERPELARRRRGEGEQLVQAELAGERVVGRLEPVAGAGHPDERDARSGPAQPVALAAVAQGHDVGGEVDAVVGVQVRDDDRVDVGRVEVAAAARRTRRGRDRAPGGSPRPRSGTRTRASPVPGRCRSTPARSTSSHDLLRDPPTRSCGTADRAPRSPTRAISGPRNRWLRRTNGSSAPVARKTWRGGGGVVADAAGRARVSMRYTSFAVSSALETSVTASPMTTESRPVSIG